MSETSLASLSGKLQEAALEVVWRQWAAIGGGAAGAHATASAVVDPEALVLVSLALAEHERRLNDVVASWVSVNSTLLSVQRLKNLRDDFPLAAAALSALAEVALQARDMRWTSLRSEPPAELLHVRGAKLRAAEPRYFHPHSLMLQLRQGMGVGVKADVLAFLLASGQHGRNWASTATIADAIGYTPAAVRRVADDLAAARFIAALENVDPEAPAQRMYSAEPSAWTNALQLGSFHTGWQSWRERYAFVVAIEEEVRRQQGSVVSRYALEVATRDLLERHRSALVRDRVMPADFLHDAGDWPALFEQATSALGQWMRNNA
jgi:hypothetical protein